MSNKVETSPAIEITKVETDRNLRIRFARETSTNPKAPVAAYFVSLPGALSGLTLKGQVFKDLKDGSYQISVPGGRNFGGILTAEMELANVNGRTIAVSGSYDESGLSKMARWEEVIKTAFYHFLQAPAVNSVQTINL